MQKIRAILNNEEGSLIVLAMVILALLTVLGISASNTSITEVQIASNNFRHQVLFYVADSCWKEGAMWLNDHAAVPARVNSGVGDQHVRNYGDVDDPPDPLVVPTNQPDNGAFGAYNIPYWYRIQYIEDTRVVGSGPNYRDFFYITTCDADETQEIDVRMAKTFKVGYR